MAKKIIKVKDKIEFQDKDIDITIDDNIDDFFMVESKKGDLRKALKNLNEIKSLKKKNKKDDDQLWFL